MILFILLVVIKSELSVIFIIASLSGTQNTIHDNIRDAFFCKIHKNTISWQDFPSWAANNTHVAKKW